MFSSPFAPEFSFIALELNDAVGYILAPDEEALLSIRATEKRRQQFKLGRAAAHAALEQLCLCSPPPILKGSEGEPVWPEEVIGSITHSGDWAVAVVAYCRDARALGIDLERIQGSIRRLDISRRISTANEQTWINEKPDCKVARTIKLFSAKESIYKAFYPVCLQHLGFLDVELTWDGEKFLAILLRDLTEDYQKGYQFEVGCLAKSGFVFTYAVL